MQSTALIQTNTSEETGDGGHASVQLGPIHFGSLADMIALRPKREFVVQLGMSAMGQKATLSQLTLTEVGACLSSGRRRIASEDVVAIFRRLVAGEASFVQRLVARFAVLEVGKSPAASRGVLL